MYIQPRLFFLFMRMPMFKFLAFLSIFLIAAANAKADDMSLIDLFGEEPKKQEYAAPTTKKEKHESPTPAKEEKVEVDKKGTFSFLNFSFLGNKDKKPELNRQKDEPQETFVERMTRMAEEGDVDACLTLGYMYLYGENGVESNPQKAFKYYSMAASQEDKIAINNLGSLYFSGIGVEKNTLKAAQMFNKAAKLGNHEAALNLAVIYLGTPSANSAKDSIVPLLQQAANGGNVIAKYILGYSYYRGFLLPKDDYKSFELLQAAATEFDEAQYQLAMRYMKAEGTPRNYGNAVKYLKQSAHQGNTDAMLAIANILAAGTSYQKNEYEAYIWFNIASAYQIKEAAEKRDILEKVLTIADLLQAQATSEAFKEKPTETTAYVRSTFGNNVTSFIDNNISRPSRRKSF